MDQYTCLQKYEAALLRKVSLGESVSFWVWPYVQTQGEKQVPIWSASPTMMENGTIFPCYVLAGVILPCGRQNSHCRVDVC